MAKKEWRLDADSKSLVASAIQNFLADRDPSVSASDWYKTELQENYVRMELYTRLVCVLPSRIMKDIEHRVSESIKASLKNREDEVARKEENLKKSTEEDRKRDDELNKREHELADKVRDKEAALALGEAEMARFKAQMQAEGAILRSHEFRGRGGFMMTPWGPTVGFGGY